MDSVFSLFYFVKIVTTCLTFILKFLISDIFFMSGAIMLSWRGTFAVGLDANVTSLKAFLLERLLCTTSAGVLM